MASGQVALLIPEVLRFSDRTVDLLAGARAAKVNAAEVKTLEELYVGFFNRIPEAAGLGYWIDQMHSGVSLTEIANQFYGAGVEFGVYSAGMTNAQFIQAVYANVLARPQGSPTAPDAQEVGYWNSYLTDKAHPEQTQGTIVLQMLHDVHANYESHPVYGFVAASLNNKAAVANYYAVEQGLGYYDEQQNIDFGIQLAGLITPTDTTAAIALVGVNAFST